jgi:hypothetical protein
MPKLRTATVDRITVYFPDASDDRMVLMAGCACCDARVHVELDREQVDDLLDVLDRAKARFSEIRVAGRDARKDFLEDDPLTPED